MCFVGGFLPLPLCYSLRFQNSQQIMPVGGFPAVWKCLFLHNPSPGWVSVPKSFVSVFVFYILSYLLLKRLGCLSRCLMSFTCIQKLFCGSSLTFKSSFDEFVREKVVPTFYSFAILPFSLRELWTFTYVRVEKNWKLISLVQYEVFELIGNSFSGRQPLGELIQSDHAILP